MWIYFVQCWDLVQALKNTNVFSNEVLVFYKEIFLLCLIKQAVLNIS